MLRKANVAPVMTGVIGVILVGRPFLSRSCWVTCWHREDHDLLILSPYIGRRQTAVSIPQVTDGLARRQQVVVLPLQNHKPLRLQLALALYLAEVLASVQRVVAVQAGDFIDVGSKAAPKSPTLAAVRL